MTIAVDAATKRVRRTFGLERSPVTRWALAAAAIGLAVASLLGSGRVEDPAVAATTAPTPAAVAVPAIPAAPSVARDSGTDERGLRSERRAARRRQRETAEPTPYAGLAPEVTARLEKALARLDAAADTEPDVGATTNESSAAAPGGESATDSAWPAAAASSVAPIVESIARPVAEAVAPSVAPETDTDTKPAIEIAETGSARVNTTARIEATQIVERVIAAGATFDVRSGIATDRVGGAQVMIVPAGSTLSDLMFDVYGFYRTDLLEAVRVANPHIADPNRIQVGETVIFPELATIANTSVRRENP